MSKSRLVSGRIKKATGAELSTDRYEYLDLANAEPDLGLPSVEQSVLIGDTDGTRTWVDITTYAEDFKGYTGSQGEIGYTGSFGFTGSQGEIGYTGSQGEIGYTGSFGFTGSQGDIGYTGSQGEIGYTGSFGFTGSQGEIGYTGSQGEIGYTGSFGFTGSQGDIGYTGSQGDTGFVGSKGDTGLGFIIAKTYSSVAALEADTAPTGIVAGQFAIIDTGDVENPENSRLYLWDGIVYNYVTDLSGAQGIKGEQGDVGFTGSSGATGATGDAGGQGYTGSQGDIGYTGSQGDIGYTGSQGDIGYTGSQGDTGFVGSQGDTGFVGSQGDIGYTGSQGDIGYTGSQGDIGYTGSLGYTGSQGDIGYTGSQGDIGYAGSQGYTGSKGDIGLEPWAAVTSDYTASNRDRLIANGSAGSFNITLPATPTVGDYIQITDGANFDLYPITILRNGNTIESFSDNVLLDLPGSTFEFIYDGATWHITSTTGPQGFTGSQGDIGFTGSAGEPGEAAAIGYTGSSGFVGSQGDIGYTGSQGDQGDIGYTGSQGDQGIIGYTGSQGDIGYTGSFGFTGSQGDIGYTGSTGADGLNVLTIYDTANDLPISADTGTIALVSDTGSLYAYNGVAWIDTSSNLRNFFYIVQTSAFTSPITGNVGYFPTRTIQLRSIEASVASKTSNITIRVRKNNTTLQDFVISGDSLTISGDFSSNTFTTSDTVFMDIVSGAGVDLAVKFNYK